MQREIKKFQMKLADLMIEICRIPIVFIEIALKLSFKVIISTSLMFQFLFISSFGSDQNLLLFFVLPKACFKNL